MSLGSGILALFLLGGGALLLFVLAGVRRVLDLLPMSTERRELVARASPVVGSTLVLLYVLFAVGALVGDAPDAGGLAVLLVSLLVVAAAWPALRDVASGVVLKSGRACRVGDTVRIDGISGRVQRLGLRALTLETSTGDEAVVPYARVVRETLFREPVREHAVHHVFRVAVPEGTPVRELKEQLRIAALHVHWHSVVRDPQVSAADGQTLEVTVFPIHPDRGPDIEAAVRRIVEPRHVRGTRAPDGDHPDDPN